MANNPILFNAVLSGVFGGVNTSRSLQSAVEADYSSQLANALAFATLLDDEIAAGSFTQQDANLLEDIVIQVTSNKGSAGLNMTTVAAIIAAFNAVRTSLEPVGSGGGTVEPLSLEVWVDPATTVVLADQNGSIATPFATLAQAVTAMTALKVINPLPGTIHLADGDYAAEGFTWGAIGVADVNTLILQGSGGARSLGTIVLTPLSSVSGEETYLTINNVGTPSGNDGFDFITFAATGIASVSIDDSHFEVIDGTGGNGESFVRIKDSTCNAISNFASELTLVDTDVLGAVSANGLFLFNANILGNVDSTGAIDARESQIDAVVAGIDVSFESCVLFSDVTANSSLKFRQCKLATDGLPDITTPSLTLQDSEISANVDVTGGTIESDSKSWNFLRASGATIAASTVFINDVVGAEGQTNWDASAPLVLTVMPLPHAAGLYSIHIETLVRTVDPTGGASIAIEANGIATGAITRNVPLAYWDGISATPSWLMDLDLANNTPPNNPLIPDVTVSSDGTAAITVTLTPNGVTGNPLVSVFATATLVARSE